MPSANGTAKSARNRAPTNAFAPGYDPRTQQRGRGPQKGQGGRPPDWLKAEMARGRALAVQQINEKLEARKLGSDQLIRVVEKWAPPEELLAPERTLTIRFVRE